MQINGVVWQQIIVGNTVYATGQFTSARPAGSALGVNETPRSNILAYDITTGNLITTWAPTLNAQGFALAARPDGKTIYVGGDFDQVSGVSRSRIAAIDATTGAVKTNFNPGANTTVRAIAVNNGNGTVYYGGFFTSIGAGSGNAPRSRAAAADASGALLPWAPVTDREIVAMIVHQASGRVILGGSFNTLNGVQARGSGSVDGVTGASMPWAANQTIQNYGSGVEIGSFTTDGTNIFGSGWTFLAGGGEGNLEGVFSADAMTGNINWINATRGDNYSIAYTNGVIYSVGHTHDAGMLGWNPQTPDPWQFQRTNAINSTVSPTLTNAYGTNSLWDYFPGFKAAQPLHWMPTLTGGTYTGEGQAAWSVAANSDYVVEGGEFPKVNNIQQQGLVRFAKRTIAGSNVDDIQNYTELTPTVTDAGAGTRAHRLEGGVGPGQRQDQGRGAAGRDHRDLHGPQDLRDQRHHVVEPSAAVLLRHHGAGRVEPDLPDPGDRPVRQRLRRSPGDLHGPRGHADRQHLRRLGPHGHAVVGVAHERDERHHRS